MRRYLIFAALVAAFLAAASNARASEQSRAAFTAEASWYWGVDTSAILVIFDHGKYRCEDRVLGWSGVPDTEIHLCLGEWRRLTLAERCHVWLHEAGHALGHDHVRHGLMAPVLHRPIAACRAWHPGPMLDYPVRPQSKGRS